MKKIVSLVLVIGGLVMMIAGINGTNTLRSNNSFIRTGKPTNKVRLMLFGGAGAAIAGFAMMLHARKRA